MKKARRKVPCKCCGGFLSDFSMESLQNALITLRIRAAHGGYSWYGGLSRTLQHLMKIWFAFPGIGYYVRGDLPSAVIDLLRKR